MYTYLFSLLSLVRMEIKKKTRLITCTCKDCWGRFCCWLHRIGSVFIRLPAELLCHILSFLPPRNIVQLASTTSAIRITGLNDTVWKPPLIFFYPWHLPGINADYHHAFLLQLVLQQWHSNTATQRSHHRQFDSYPQPNHATIENMTEQTTRFETEEARAYTSAEIE